MYSLEQLLWVGVLQQLANRPAIEGDEDAIPLGERGQDHHPNVGARRKDLACGLDSVAHWHRQVAEHYVVVETLGRRHRLLPVGRRTHDLDVIGPGQQLLETGTDRRCLG